LTKEIKRASTVWVKDRFPQIAKFSWQAGYAAFSVSSSQLETVKRYVAKQVEHHRIASFQEEFSALLRKHGLAFDEQYVWE